MVIGKSKPALPVLPVLRLVRMPLPAISGATYQSQPHTPLMPAPNPETQTDGRRTYNPSQTTLALAPPPTPCSQNFNTNFTRAPRHKPITHETRNPKPVPASTQRLARATPGSRKPQRLTGPLSRQHPSRPHHTMHLVHVTASGVYVTTSSVRVNSSRVYVKASWCICGAPRTRGTASPHNPRPVHPCSGDSGSKLQAPVFRDLGEGPKVQGPGIRERV